MYGKTTWKNVHLDFSVELSRDTDTERDFGIATWDDLTYGKELPASVLELIDRSVPSDLECLELGFNVQSSGYYTPGKISDLPEDSYPPEGEEERIVSRVYLSLADRPNVSLSKRLVDLLASLYADQIAEIELPDQGSESD